MAFCTGCGADVTGKTFCVQCGRPVASAAAGGAAPTPPQAPQATPPPAYAAPPQQPVYASGPAPGGMPPKKSNAVLWIVLGIVGFFVLMGLLGIFAVGMFVHKVKQNPALAMAKLLTAANPDVEVVDSDSGKNTVTFRDKKTGETITMNFDEIKQGKIAFRGKDGKSATIEANGSGGSGSVSIKTPEGSMQFGAGANAKMPDWVPTYPGTNPEGTFSMQGGEGTAGAFKFNTKDTPQAVLTYYEEGFKKAGFKVTANITGQIVGTNGGMITAEDAASKRTCMVIVGTDGSGTVGNVNFSMKQ